MRRRSRLMAACVAMAGWACTGAIGDPHNGPMEEEDVESTVTSSFPKFDFTCVRSATPARVLKLSSAQIDNTTAAYLGTTRSYAEVGFPEAAEQIARDRAAVEVVQLGCAPQAAPKLSPADACITTYIRMRGKQLLRRPLAADEVNGFYGNYLAGFTASGGNAEATIAGMRALLASILQSPQFLYRTELGDINDDGVTRLSRYELAAAIAYTVTDGPPDATLTAHADDDDLDPATIESEARRLIATDAGRAKLTRFIMEWLGTSAVLAKAGTMLTGSVARALVTETQLTIEDVLFNGRGTLAELLTVPYTFANKELADFYGYVGPTGSSFEKVSLTELARPGILAHGSFLAANASPVTIMRRGNIARTTLFCEALPSGESVGLPADFQRPAFNPNLDADQTRREQVFSQSGDISGPGTPCYACHQYFVPIGNGFEAFDDAGRARTEDNGWPVDASGRVVNAEYVEPVTGQILGPFEGAGETAFADYPGLAQVLATNGRVHACAARRLFAFASARRDIYDNNCDVRDFQAAFVDNGGDIVEALVGFVTSNAFAERAVE